MPTIFTKNGFRFHFYTNEGNEPCHVHIVGHGGEMKVWLPSLQIQDVYRLSPKRQKDALKLARENRELIMEKWNEHSRKKGK